MSCTLDTTVGGASANGYCSIAEADAYHAAHLYAATWNTASADTKCQALQMATRLLDATWTWHGMTATLTQALLWPRFWSTGKNGWWIAGNVIPQELKNATAEYARQLIDSNRTADSDVETEGLTAVKAGSVELTFRPTVQAKPVPDAVFYLIAHLGILQQRGSGSVPLSRA